MTSRTPKARTESKPLSTQREVEDVCDQIVHLGRCGFDTEFVMEDRYAAEVCLIQLATDKGVFLVDPLGGVDPAPVWELVCSPKVEKITHAGQEDLGLAVRACGRPPANVFDVQVAAGLIGFDYPLSLQKLVSALVRVRLHKSKTLTNWRQRPLSEAQVQYAIEDVAYLLPMRDSLQKRLSQRGRMEWAREEFKRLEDPRLYLRSDEQPVSRVKGAGSLEGQALAVANELALWREALAMRLNRPVRAVLKDHLLVEIARHGMTSVAEIQHLRGINLSRRDLQGLCEVVRNALAQPAKEASQRRAQRASELPGEAAAIGLATSVAQNYCMENEIAYGMATSRRAIGELVRYRRDPQVDAAMPELLSGWRGQSIGRVLDDVLRGRLMVRVDPHGRDGPPLSLTPANPH